MRKSLLLALFACLVSKGFGQFSTLISYPNTVDLFGLCEISFKLPTVYTNPYNPDTINAYAVFTGPDNSTYTIDAFYFEGYTFQQNVLGQEEATRDNTNDGWKIRFTPNCVGTWTFMIKAFDKNGDLNQPFMNVNHTFTCTAVTIADGFISMANSRFLKRDIVRNGVRKHHSFFPIGPNIAWYESINYGDWTAIRGIYDYKRRIDSLDGNANYMRIFVNRYQYLSLYGPEYAEIAGDTIVYFDSIINQKDSAELDYIIAYALQHGISIMPCIFNQNDFRYENSDPNDVGVWANNPFQYNLQLSYPCEFFTNTEAMRVTKQLIRYIVSRWSYATNIMSWELWNEVDKVLGSCECYTQADLEDYVLDWHEEMAEYLRAKDPFDHCVSSSFGNYEKYPYLYSNLFSNLDFVQQHDYENIQNAELRHELLNRMYNRIKRSHTIDYQDKPFFMGEFGFGQNHNGPKYANKDPYGIDLHNSLWSSLFFTSMGPASFWWWNYIDERDLYNHFNPLLTFGDRLPIPSESFTAEHTGSIIDHKLVFPNSLQTYYMINGTQDTIYGWSQDTAFAYSSLRWLTDSVCVDTTQWGTVLRFKDNAVFDSLGYVYTLDPLKKPSPSSDNNTITIPITSQPVGKTYTMQWFDSETGLPFNITTFNVTVQQDSQGNKFLSFQFPSHIRNLKQHTINNTFGDAVFILTKKEEGPSPKNTKDNYL